MWEIDSTPAPSAMIAWASKTLLPQDIRMRFPTSARQMMSSVGYAMEMKAVGVMPPRSMSVKETYVPTIAKVATTANKMMMACSSTLTPDVSPTAVVALYIAPIRAREPTRKNTSTKEGNGTEFPENMS